VCLVGVDVSERALVNLFDSFVVITSIASVFLCTRSVYRALQLGQVCVCVCVCVLPFVSLLYSCSSRLQS